MRIPVITPQHARLLCCLVCARIAQHRPYFREAGDHLGGARTDRRMWSPNTGEYANHRVDLRPKEVLRAQQIMASWRSSLGQQYMSDPDIARRHDVAATLKTGSSWIG